MPEGLLRKAMHVQRSLVAQNKQCWLSLYKDTICEFPSGSDIWAKWWSEHDFRCDCRIVNEGICHTQTSESQTYTPWEEVLDSAIIQLFKDTWKADVARIESKSGNGKNKLRTYNLFKPRLEYEPYLNYVQNRDKRILLTKFRIEICPLRIETGRYEIIGVNKGIIASERTCLVCNGQQVEDEFHFLLECPVYNMRRVELVNIFRISCRLSEREMEEIKNNMYHLFISIMSSQNENIINGVADFIWDAFLIREKLLLDRNR